MSSTQTSPTVVLTAEQRNVVWACAVDDVGTLGDGMHHAALRRDLGAVEDGAPMLRVLLDLLDALGWREHDPREEFPIALAPGALIALLRGWRERLDGVLHDQVAGPFAEADRDDATRAIIDRDLDARFVLDQVLEEVTP